jgi:copper chaperone NosL
MKNLKISTLTKGMLLFVAMLLVSSIFFPIWRIELSAPQYPEGLVLQLHANKIGGDVDIINGLNHYIGMKTLHAENFIEFTVLPYILCSFAFIALVMVAISKKKGLYLLFGSYVAFGVLAAIDFYRWNYDYGHNLDPNAAIKVPGMAYQPPLLGYKQLLNFGAYSIPDIGGMMLLLVGLLLLIAVLKETNFLDRFKKNKSATATVFALLFALSSCGSNGPEPIKLNVDSCDFCKMSIADGKFGAEVITQKGRTYKFDDLGCMMNYCKENKNTVFSNYYVHDYTKNNTLIPAEKAYYLKGGSIVSPMQGNTMAFSSEKDAKQYAIKLKAIITNWVDLSRG